MFVGHLGAGLAAKRLAPEVRLGVLFLAAMGLDALLWIFVLLGLESVHFPASVGEARYPTFTFPYSHGLVASLAWSAIAFALVRVAGRSLGAALVWRRRCSPTSSWMSSSTSRACRSWGTRPTTWGSASGVTPASSSPSSAGSVASGLVALLPARRARRGARAGGGSRAVVAVYARC